MVYILSTFVLYLCSAYLPDTSYPSLSRNVLCHVFVFDRLLCELLFLCDSEIWAFPCQRMTLFSWKKLISGLFILSCQKSWVFLLMERCCIKKKILCVYFLLFLCVYLCVYIYTIIYIKGKIIALPPLLTGKHYYGIHWKGGGSLNQRSPKFQCWVVLSSFFYM